MNPYYTDVLAAGWMAKHFGMEFIDTETSKEGAVYKLSYALMLEGDDLSQPMGRYVVHPDSLGLFEPRAGDIVITGNRAQGAAFVDKEVLDRYARATKEQRARVNLIVIQRDGKPFFWPETEL